MDQGILGSLPNNYPYLTIAHDIQAANASLYPEVRGSGPLDDDPHEPGIKIVAWYDYTPTSAVDVDVTVTDIPSYP